MPLTTAPLNATHDVARRSWLESANVVGADFPIQNLPFGLFKLPGQLARGGVAIGDKIVDLAAMADAGLLEGQALGAARAASEEDLTSLLRLGNLPASALRAKLSDLLRTDAPDTRLRDAADRFLLSMHEVEMKLPLRVRQFSDMCVSTFHIGRKRGDDERGQPICPPVFRTLPVGYDGRASSVIVSGSPVRRPNGVWERVPGSGEVEFGPEPRQDYELELAIWFGGMGNELGAPIAVGAADESIFGYGLLNDWSARGIQMWETMLGPFLGKSLSTTVSPWIITAEALRPFQTAAFDRPAGDPPVPAHLFDQVDQSHGGLDLSMHAYVETAAMAQAKLAPEEICATNFRHMYWTPAQMVAHHTSNGCALAAGDLLGSGTCSGPELSAAACLMERTDDQALHLSNGERRQWLADGDTIILRAQANREGFASIGFGEAHGTVLPSVDYPT